MRWRRRKAADHVPRHSREVWADLLDPEPVDPITRRAAELAEQWAEEYAALDRVLREPTVPLRLPLTRAQRYRANGGRP